jgi:glycosyltransferase involved in cell wall biosynthesis
VSIGLPVRNGQRYLRRAVASILDQDFKEFELIIADNASDDDTEAICRELAATDSRIRYYRNDENIGCAGNFNKVFHLANGKYFKWQAYDDECYPAMLSRCVRALEEAPASVAMVYPLAELIDANGNTLESPLDSIESADARPHRRVARVLWTLNMCDAGFGLIKTEYLRRTRLMGPFFAGDYVLLCELAMLGEIRQVDEVLFRLRAHEQRSTVVHTTARALQAFYAPSENRRALFGQSWEGMVVELLGSVRRSPLPPAEKLKLFAAVPATHYWRRFKNAGGRWKRRLKASAPSAVWGRRQGERASHVD